MELGRELRKAQKFLIIQVLKFTLSGSMERIQNFLNNS